MIKEIAVPRAVDLILSAKYSPQIAIGTAFSLPYENSVDELYLIELMLGTF